VELAVTAGETSRHCETALWAVSLVCELWKLNTARGDSD